MPRIPVYAAEQAINPGSAPNIQIDTSNFTADAAMGGAISGLGKEVMQIAEHQAKRAEQVQALSTKNAQDRAVLGIQTEDLAASNTMPVTGEGWAKSRLENADKKLQDFVSGVPASLRPQYEQSAQLWKDKLHYDYSKQEADQRTKWATDTIVTKADSYQKVVGQSPDQLEAARADLRNDIAMAPLPEAAKPELTRKAEAALERSALATITMNDPLRAQAILARGKNASALSMVDRIVKVESGDGSIYQSSTSSAAGAGQFIDSTWLDMVQKYRPELTQGRDRQAVLDLRKDPSLSKDMVGRYSEENAKYFATRDIPATPGNLYLAHFLGPAGATKLLSVTGDTSISSLLSPKEIGANRGILEGKKVQDVVAWAEKKMGGVAGGATTPLADPQFKNVPYADLLTLTQSAEQARAHNSEQGRLMFEKEREQRAEGLLKEAASLNEKNQLTPDFVETIRPHVSSTQYGNLLKALRADAADDDPKAIEFLTRNLDAMNPEQFQREASPLLADKRLKTSTYISLSEKNRSASKDDAPASAYKSGRDVVKTTLDPGQLLSGPAAAIGRSNQAQALIEFDNWSVANPRATRADAISTAQDIIKRNQVVPFDQMKLGTGVSKYFGPKSRSAISLDDVAAAEVKLYDDMQANRLSKEQSEFEVRQLNNWREILAQEQSAKAAKGATNGKR
jgi:hypothetical protein